MIYSCPYNCIDSKICYKFTNLKYNISLQIDKTWACMPSLAIQLLQLSHNRKKYMAEYVLLQAGIQYNDIIDLGFVSCHIHMHAGPTSVSMNVHQLRHLVYHVKNFGPLWVYSCFSFESRNGDLKRLFPGTKNTSNQVLDIIYLHGQLNYVTVYTTFRIFSYVSYRSSMTIKICGSP